MWHMCDVKMGVLFFLITFICTANALSKIQIQCNKPNEHFGCGSFCDTTCATLGEACPVQTYVCVERCYCVPGYARDSEDNCIPIVDCPPTKPCGGDPNAISVPCGDPCPETCENKNSPTLRPCPLICIKNGCRCKAGFVRNSNGKCILPENCPVALSSCKGDPNAISVPCGDPCPLTCENKDSLTPRACPEVCIINGCTCKPGYVKNKDGRCILASDCPKPICDDPNAISVPCGDPCPLTCENKDNLLPRPCPAICIINGCKCKPGYVKNKNGICILAADCPKPVICEDPNSISVPCGDPCPVTCENKDNPFPRPCPKICIINGCKCKPGYVKNKNGKCILREHCFPGVCGVNEEYHTCPPLCPPEQSCKAIFSGLKIKCAPPNPNDICKPRCRCKPGYVRNDIGTCVLTEKCCPSNSEIVLCPNMCPGGTCSQKNFTPCKIGCPYKGCQCKAGYVKWSSTNNKCVPIKSCPCGK